MENKITIREAVTAQDVAHFWTQLHAYYKRDLFPNPQDGDRAYFLGEEYRNTMEQIHGRPENRCYFLFFQRNGQDIGFGLPVIYTTEDGKCFLMEFCVYPEYRGQGTGRECAQVLLRWGKEQGAHYTELNYGGDNRRLRFWKSVGFVENGVDEWGESLMLLPPQEDVPITVEILTDPGDCQLLKLENGFKQAIGEELPTEEQQKQLQRAIQDGTITFFVAKRGYRMVGMCSVAKCYSTFSYSDVAVYDDFYVESAFRKKGIARKLANAAQRWCKDKGISSLTVCCADCDEKLYQALGFDVELGRTLAHMEMVE